MEVSFATRTGRNELRKTKDDPRQVIPMTTKIDPTTNNDGGTKMKSILVMDPMIPNEISNALRLFPVGTSID